ncbi:MAG: hypothetical protein WCS42_11055 [Verrucomicrobiota bacterium]
MARGQFIFNVLTPAKKADGSGGGANTQGIVVGGAVDSQGNAHTLEVYELTTCEDRGDGTLEYFTRLIVCSDRFKLPGQ